MSDYEPGTEEDFRAIAPLYFAAALMGAWIFFKAYSEPASLDTYAPLSPRLECQCPCSRKEKEAAERYTESVRTNLATVVTS